MSDYIFKKKFIQYMIVSENIYGEVRLHAVGSQFRFSLTKIEILIALIKKQFFLSTTVRYNRGCPLLTTSHQINVPSYLKAIRRSMLMNQ